MVSAHKENFLEKNTVENKILSTYILRHHSLYFKDAHRYRSSCIALYDIGPFALIAYNWLVTLHDIPQQ